MVWLVQDSVNDGCEMVSLRLQGASASALDLVGPVGDVSEEPVHLLLHFGLGAEAGVRRDFLPNPAPDGLVQMINYATLLLGSGRITRESGQGRLYRLSEGRPLDRRVILTMADADRLDPLD
jgi:hypothetical protein